jgi:hypothetical protein
MPRWTDGCVRNAMPAAKGLRPRGMAWRGEWFRGNAAGAPPGTRGARGRSRGAKLAAGR